MALGDGIRRNMATISDAERGRFIAAVLALDTTKIYPDGVTYWDKQEEIHKNAHAAGQDVHAGPAFVPWHRELCNRLEGLLREVDPALSLHYWDWTTDPRPTLFTPQFMGSANGDAGVPLQNFESTEGGGHTHIWRNVNGGNPGAPGIAADQNIVTAGDAGAPATQYPAFLQAVQSAHNTAHGYIGGSIGIQHFSFHDPFVFLLHSNQDRLWAMWQLAPGKEWRLDPNQVYGNDGTAPSITDNLEPWSGGSGLRPWAPPDNQQVVKTCKHPSVVAPPRYDTNPTAQLVERGNLLHLSGTTTDGHLWHTIRFPSGAWSRFGDVEGQTGDRGFIVDVDLQSIGNQVHLCATNNAGGLWHTIRRANGSWFPFGDVESQTGDRGSFVRVGIAEVNGELHACGTTTDGHLWHTIRHANGSWTAFGDVEGQTGDRGSFTDVDCAGVNGELHVCGVTSDGHLWHAIRRASGSWSPFGDVEGQTGDRGNFTHVSIGEAGGELHVSGVTSNGRLWHTIRRTNGSWFPFGDVEGQAGDRGSFRTVSVDGLYIP